MVSTLLAQVVLTLRSVFIGSNCSVLITTERNRIYAVTRKNRIILSCFSVITISQFALGLYGVAYAATRKCGSVTWCRPRFLLINFDFSAVPMPPIPLPLYVMCSLATPWPATIAYTTMSLVYGTKHLLFFVWETSTLIVPQTL
jgi:hypothetical protein